MAIKGYFYNAMLNENEQYDILYNDEDFSRYLKQIVGNGVFPTPSTQFQVEANTGMSVTVHAGNAWLEGHKIENDEDISITIDSASQVMNRKDRIVLYSDSVNLRAAGVKILKGTAAINPVAPDINTGIQEGEYRLGLAVIDILAGATEITAANITDTRGDSDVCGFVAGLIQQVDTSTLYQQWVAAFNSMYNQLAEWQEDIKAQFDTWYYNLTSNLTVGAYIRTFHKVVRGPADRAIVLDMTGYTYELNDVIIANLNGLTLTNGDDYVLTVNNGVATITLDADDIKTNNLFEITVLKTSMAQTSGGLQTRVKGTKFIRTISATPGQANGFIVNNTGTTNEIVVTNRNLVDFTQIDASTTVNGLTFVNNRDEGIEIGGTTTDADAYLEIDLDPEAFNIPAADGIRYWKISNGNWQSATTMIIDFVFTDTTTASFNTRFGDTTIDFVNMYSDKVVDSVKVRIGYSGTSGSVIQNETVFPMIYWDPDDEYTLDTSDFVPGTRSTFTYDGGITKPLFTDSTNYIYTTDSAVSDMMVIYTVLDEVADGDDISY